MRDTTAIVFRLSGGDGEGKENRGTGGYEGTGREEGGRREEEGWWAILPLRWKVSGIGPEERKVSNAGFSALNAVDECIGDFAPIEDRS